jgi:type III secretion protein C
MGPDPTTDVQIMQSTITSHRVAGLAVSMLLLHSSVLSAQPSWNETPITINGQDRPVGDVLRDVITAGGLQSDIPKRLNGKVNGVLDQAPQELFHRLVGAYNLAWWSDGDVIRISPISDTRTRTIELAPLGETEAVELLRTLKITNDHLPLHTTTSTLKVSGPSRYVGAVEEAIETARQQKLLHQSDAQASDTSIQTFRLRHASAGDIEYDIDQRTHRVAGVASLLRQLLTTSVTTAVVDGNGADVQASPLKQLEEVTSEDLLGAPRQAPVSDGPVNASSVGDIVADTRTNSVVVRAAPSVMGDLEATINKLDVPQESVEIEATVVDVVSGSGRELGIDWGVLGSKGAIASGGQDIATSTITGSQSGFIAQIRAMEAAGKADIQSQPRILTLNNSEAVIASQDTMHVRVAGNQDVGLYEVRTGLSLRVTPMILPGEDDNIRLTIDIEDGTLDAETSVDGIPTVRSQRITTQAIVREGEGLLIGGYKFGRTSTRERRVPFLGRLPLIGALFRYRDTREERFERMIMITPRMLVAKSTADRSDAGVA